MIVPLALVKRVVLVSVRSVSAVIYYLKNSKKQEKEPTVGKVLSDENRYKVDKELIEDAIKEKDWETLEDMLDSRTSDFPDLIEMIKKALENKK